jgi:hypothetical protein
MTMGPMDETALAGLRAARDGKEELTARRRVELQAVRVERDALAALIVARELELVALRTELRARDDRAGFLVGWLDARKLP